MRRIRLRTVLPVVLAFIGVALLGVCLAAARSSTESLLAKYKGATCLPLMVNSGISPPDTRAWNATVTTKNGSEVTVNAATMPGGIVTVTYLASGQRFIAANAGDYVYPYDIRIDNQNDRLYVVASGLAGGIWSRTVLFEYDLQEHRETARRGVRDKDLPKACPGPAQPNQ